MEGRHAPTGGGHYSALGVPPGARPDTIERAFLRWRQARSAGSVGEGEFHAAERAYHVLADPGSRTRHDRQLGLLTHPAWREEQGREARALARRGLRALASGRPAAAQRLLDAAAGRCGPGSAEEAWLALAIVRGGGCARDAVRLAARAVARAPREAALRFALAESLGAAGRPDRAAGERRHGWAIILAETLRAALRPHRPGGRL